MGSSLRTNLRFTAKAAGTVAGELAALIVCGASFGVHAADVPARPVFFDPDAPPATFAPSFPPPRTTTVFVPPPPPMFDWTGLYLGLDAGYGFDSKTSFALSGTDALTFGGLQNGSVPSRFSTNANGFVGGAQVGFNKELDPTLIPPLAKIGGALLLGVEADAFYTGLSDTSTAVGGTGSATLHGRTEFVGTARGRLGIAFDRLLVYGTGGFAYGGVNNAAFIAAAGGNSFAGSGSSLRTGYVYGGGLAYAFPATPLFKVFSAPAVTVRLEYLHYDLGSSSFTAANIAGTGNAYNLRNDYNASLVRAGIDYKFAIKIPPPPY